MFLDNSSDKTEAIIILNGAPLSRELTEQITNSSALVVCADGAINQFLNTDLKPDLIIGDLDSALTDQIDPKQLIHRPSQYATDFEKALELCIARDFKTVLVSGICGRRSDHTLTNFSIFKKYHHKLRLSFDDNYGHGKIYCGPAQIRLSTQPKQIISLLPITAATSISTNGLLYPLINADLEFGYSEGQSNQSTTSQAEITFKSGFLLIYQLHLNAEINGDVSH